MRDFSPKPPNPGLCSRQRPRPQSAQPTGAEPASQPQPADRATRDRKPVDRSSRSPTSARPAWTGVRTERGPRRPRRTRATAERNASSYQTRCTSRCAIRSHPRSGTRPAGWARAQQVGRGERQLKHAVAAVHRDALAIIASRPGRWWCTRCARPPAGSVAESETGPTPRPTGAVVGLRAPRLAEALEHSLQQA